MKKHFKIGFLGNERHLLHAIRAMTRFGIFSEQEEYPYTFFLFGKFPQEIIKDQAFEYQYIGEDRIDLEAFADIDGYDLILDPEQNFKAGGIYSLSEWFEIQLNLASSGKSTPFISSSIHCQIRGSHFRVKSNMIPVGNMIFLMPPSPQDIDWPELPQIAAPWWEQALDVIDKCRYGIVYPQIRLVGNPEPFDYRLFFSGHEEAFQNFCFMPACTTLAEIIYHLSVCKMYVGWDNLIADIAAALRIPSIIIHSDSRRTAREVFSVRQDEYLLRHIYFSHGLRWDHEKLREALDFIETRFTPFSRSIGEYDRVRDILRRGESAATGMAGPPA